MIFDLGILAPVAGGVGLLVALVIYLLMLKQPVGTGKMVAVAEEIKLGAMTFIKEEYRRILTFVIVVFILIAFLNFFAALAFLAGAISSELAGFIGMNAAARGNVRTAAAAKDGDMAKALVSSFYSGSVVGIVVASLGLLALGGIYYFFSASADIAYIIIGFSMGASSIALFARIGGGIFTKAADMGADFVGKVEAGIPEDDSRNPGVIADHVGDNVGDIVGMGADVYESYVGAMVAAIAIAASLNNDLIEKLYTGASKEMLMSLPLLMSVVGLGASLIGILSLNFFKNMKPTRALQGSELLTGVIFLCGVFYFMELSGYSLNLFWAVLSGIIAGFFTGKLIHYYTSSSPIKNVTAAAKTGAATNIISGLAVGFESVGGPLILIATAVYLAFEFAGIYGVAISAVGMLATVGMAMTLNSFGPIVDNANGISKMAKLSTEAQEITNSLDSLGSSTTAVGRGFAVLSAAMTALALFIVYKQEVHFVGLNDEMDISNPRVFIGMILGVVIVFVVAALTLKSVGKTTAKMILEIRRQFRDIPGLLSGSGKPDNAQCVEISTQAALREMIAPVLLAVFAPILIGEIFGVAALGGTIAGSLFAGIGLAIFMANSGSVWDNAKKYFESTELVGEKNNIEAYQAMIVGDTVGDPLKDAAGPALSIIIKLIAVVAILIVPLLK